MSVIPEKNLAAYEYFWKLEHWLREIIYTELKVAFGNQWEGHLGPFKGYPPLKSLKNDKRLTHMKTASARILDYVQFKTLFDIILLENNWRLFSSYFPPRKQLRAKKEELEIIRHRLCHFRPLHKNDYDRLILFLKDIDHQLWLFCTSYNDLKHDICLQDEICREFAKYDPFPWTEVKKNTFARVGMRDGSIKVDLTIGFAKRPWTKRGPFNKRDCLYHFNFMTANQKRLLDYDKILERTKKYHSDCIHIMLDNFRNQLGVTVPVCIDKKHTKELVKAFYEACLCDSRYGFMDPDEGEKRNKKLLEEWPEYVLSGDNPLTFLCPDMPCNFLL
jgi:hypothetical protein